MIYKRYFSGEFDLKGVVTWNYLELYSSSSEVYLKLSQTSKIELVCENSECLSVVDYFCKVVD